MHGSSKSHSIDFSSGVAQSSASAAQGSFADPILSIIESGATSHSPHSPSVAPVLESNGGPLQILSSVVAPVASGTSYAPLYSDPQESSPPQSPAAQGAPSTIQAAANDQAADRASQAASAFVETPAAVGSSPAVQMTPVSSNKSPTPAAVIIGGATMKQGDPGTEFGGTPVSVGSGAVIIGSSTLAIPQQVSTGATANRVDPIASVGGQPILGVPSPVSVGQIQENANPSENTAPHVVIGGQTYPAPPPGRPVAIGSVTLQPGGAPATISGQMISLGPSDVVVGASTAALVPPDVARAPAATFAVGNNEYVASSGHPLVIGGSTLSAGGAPATVSGHVISLDPSGVSIDHKIVPFIADSVAADQDSAVFNVDGQTFRAASGSTLIVGPSTLSVGGPAGTISGPIVSPASSGVMIDNSLASYRSATSAANSDDGAIFTLDNGLYSASSGQALIIGSATLSPGAPAQTISGHVVSLGSAGVVVDGNTAFYSQLSTSGSPSEFTIDGGIYSAPRPGQPLVVGSMILTPGGPAATLSDGEVVSVGSAGVVIGSSTVPFYTGVGSRTSPSTFSVDGNVYTAPAPGQSLVIGGATVSPGGPAVTLPDGEVVSIGSRGVNLGGSNTIPFDTIPSGVSSSETFTVDGHVYTAPPPGHALTIGSMILSSGGPPGTFADGHTVSIGPHGVVIGGTSLVPFITSTATNPFAPTFTADGHIYTAPLPGERLTMGSVTISPGGPEAMLGDGEAVSLGPSGVVVDGKITIPYARGRSTAQPGSRISSADPKITDQAIQTSVETFSSSIPLSTSRFMPTISSSIASSEAAATPVSRSKQLLLFGCIATVLFVLAL